MGVQMYAIGGLMVALIVLKGWTGVVISDLEEEVTQLTTELVVVNNNATRLRNSIAVQNTAIDKLTLDITTRSIELEEWRNKPAEIRYNTIYKEIPAYVDMRKESCENTKAIIDVARNYDFNAIN